MQVSIHLRRHGAGNVLPGFILTPFSAEIDPIRVQREDQPQFLLSSPSLDFFFPSNSGHRMRMAFEIDQHVKGVPGGERVLEDLMLVLEDAPG